MKPYHLFLASKGGVIPNNLGFGRVQNPLVPHFFKIMPTTSAFFMVFRFGSYHPHTIFSRKNEVGGKNHNKRFPTIRAEDFLNIISANRKCCGCLAREKTIETGQSANYNIRAFFQKDWKKRMTSMVTQNPSEVTH